jgi:hypothetical protein
MMAAGLVVGLTLWLLTMPGRRRRRERELAALRSPEEVVDDAIARAQAHARVNSRTRV